MKTSVYKKPGADPGFSLYGHNRDLTPIFRLPDLVERLAHIVNNVIDILVITSYSIHYTKLYDV